MINATREAFEAAGLPIISVDTKKKELIGDFANNGRTWRTEPDFVNAHDFTTDAECRAVPYGIFDITQNQGFVGIGTSADTPAFAVAVIVQWWRTLGQLRYPDARELLILADSGGSNGYRLRVFKWLLQKELADPFNLRITVCHYPSGASKWNPIEHRLFGPISINWSGLPLRSLDLMQAAINGTTNDSGLTATSQQIPGDFPTGQRIPDADWHPFAATLDRTEICPQWNYTIFPSNYDRN